MKGFNIGDIWEKMLGGGGGRGERTKAILSVPLPPCIIYLFIFFFVGVVSCPAAKTGELIDNPVIKQHYF